MGTTLHKDLTGADLHVNKLHADTHVVAGTDPLALAESQVTDLPADLADLASGLDGKALTVHTHTKSQITDFPVIPDYPVLGTSALKDVPASGDATVDQVVKGDDTRLTDARTPVAHSHPESEVTDLVTDLAEKVGTGDSRLSDARTPVAHTQAESTVINLVDDLSGKAPTVHAHVKADISDFPTLGTASPLDVPVTGDASATQVVKGSDTRLTDTRIPPDAGVTYAKMQHVSATDKVLGRSTAGAGDVEEIACTAAGRALLADTSAAWQLTTLGAMSNEDGTVTYAKMQPVSSGKILGRVAAGAGKIEEIVCTAAGRALIDDADAAAQLATLGAVATGDSRLSDARTPVAHAHVKADVSDFPASMPASDVSAWAKAASKPTYVAGEIGSISVAGRLLIDDVDAAAQRATLGAVATGDSRLSDARVASDVSAWAKNATKPVYTPAEIGAEAVTDKSTSVPTDAASDTKYPSVKAVKDYADGLVAGLLDYRGAYDASGNAYPTTGGSGTAGAVMKGDMWAISVAGTLGGVAIQIGDAIIAKIDTPAQTAGNWNMLNTNISYVPEDQANKENTTLDTSTVKYPTNNLVKAGLDGKVDEGDPRLSDARAPTAHNQALATITDVTATAAEVNVLDGITATVTELNTVDGVTSNVQTQLGTKIAGPVSSAFNHLVTFVDTTGKVVGDGGAIPTSLPASDVSAWAKSGTKPTYASSEITNISAAGRALIDDADAAAQLATLGALPLAGGTMTGKLYGQANTDYTTSQVHNVIESTGDASGGGNGDIWIKYTA